MDDTEGTTWLSYDDLAKARGISRASAKRLSFRRNWPRITSNDGTSRVGVPAGGLTVMGDGTADVSEVIPGDTPADITPISPPLVTALSPGGLSDILNRVAGLARDHVELAARLAEETCRRGEAEAALASASRLATKAQEAARQAAHEVAEERARREAGELALVEARAGMDTARTEAARLGMQLAEARGQRDMETMRAETFLAIQAGGKDTRQHLAEVVEEARTAIRQVVVAEVPRAVPEVQKPAPGKTTLPPPNLPVLLWQLLTRRG